MRCQYEEFIAISKLETDSYRQAQKVEYETLKEEYQALKNEKMEEKRRLTEEYQNILNAIQTQFEDYQTTAEYIFNLEMAKYQDLLSSQSLRYEEEILYIVQVKDKLYSDMMIAKDAKIMSLIEGADLQTVLQRNEMVSIGQVLV